jgi:trehalose-6-phosphatase
MPIADATGLTVRPFDGGIEILGAKRNKADAVRAILAEMEIDTPVAYLGDDQTDEDAFRALQGRGVSILVRPHWRETAADIWLRTPIELSAFFHDWLDACQPASPNQADEDAVSLKKAV